MEVFTSVRRALAITGVIAALGLAAATAAEAGCGCQKPPPPRAAVRPFVGHVDQMITLFDDRLAPGQRYDVRFVSTVDGSSDSSRGKALPKRDFADGQVRTQLRVSVGDVSFGPCTIIVSSNGTELYRLGDDQFTVTAPPIALHDFSENLVRDNYRAGVGADGTVYIPVDVNEVSQATTFVGMADGFPLHFEAQSVAMYNEQGFLMQLLDPTVPGLFQIDGGVGTASDMLSYWRHEFVTYKAEHRKVDARRTDSDPDWHADGSYHVDHNHIVVAISGTLADGSRPAPGSTPPFKLVVSSVAGQ